MLDELRKEAAQRLESHDFLGAIYPKIVDLSLRRVIAIQDTSEGIKYTGWEEFREEYVRKKIRKKQLFLKKLNDLFESDPDDLYTDMDTVTGELAPQTISAIKLQVDLELAAARKKTTDKILELKY